MRLAVRRAVPIVTLAAGLLGTRALAAQPHHNTSVHADVPDSVAHIVDRQSPRRARYAITSRDSSTMLLLMDTTIVAQFTDRGLATLGRDATKKTEGEGVGARWVSEIAASLVRPLLDHGIAYHLRDLASADYADGRLRLVGSHGTEVFGDVEIGDAKLVESFSPSDARAFVQHVRDARARLR